MKLMTRLFVVTLLSISIAWLLSYLPKLQSQLPNERNELQVFNHDNLMILTEDNLVDWIVALPLHMELKSVDWSDRILSVDFEASTPIESSKVIYNQLLDVVYYGLGRTTNVDRVWVRLVQTDEGTNEDEAPQPKRLLLALAANRTQLSEQDYNFWKNDIWSAEELIDRRFQLTKTPLWLRLNSE